jgi:membrane fusion protein (multidrug efflux system)
MFVGVSVVFPEEEHVVIVPTTAIVHAPYGDSVYVVAAGPKGGQIAQQTFIRTGETRGDFVRVTDGLSGEETVVTSGAFKLHTGAAIKVDNEVAPHPELAPHPVNR